MNKILVMVYVPFLCEKFEILIPINKKVGTVKTIIINTINEITEGSISNTKLNLYEKKTSKILENNVYVNSCNIKNGSSLILL